MRDARVCVRVCAVIAVWVLCGSRGAFRFRTHASKTQRGHHPPLALVLLQCWLAASVWSREDRPGGLAQMQPRAGAFSSKNARAPDESNRCWLQEGRRGHKGQRNGKVDDMCVERKSRRPLPPQTHRPATIVVTVKLADAHSLAQYCCGRCCGDTCKQTLASVGVGRQ